MFPFLRNAEGAATAVVVGCTAVAGWAAVACAAEGESAGAGAVGSVAELAAFAAVTSAVALDIAGTGFSTAFPLTSIADFTATRTSTIGTRSSDSSDYGYGYPPDNGYSPSGYPYVDNSGGGAPAVIINQNSGGYPYGPPAGQAYAPPPPPPAPAIREYTGPATQAQAQQYQAPLYLIAFSDGMIRAVLAYWVDGATLHYVSMDHEQKQAPLSTVDRALSDRLNRERNVTFELPH